VLQDLVNKWFLGLDHPAIASGLHYVVAAGTLFGSGGPSYTDIVQGHAEDCYFLAALGEVDFRSPQTIRNMFINNGDGTYTVRFFNNGVADYVTVDSYLPVDSSGNFWYANIGSSAGDSSNVLWVELAEKAYAQLADSGWSRSTHANSYAAINLGWEGDALNQLTGRSVTSTMVSNTSASLAAIVNAFNAGNMIGLDTKAATASNIVPNHVYVMLGYNSSTHLFLVYNPWGFTQSLSWSQLVANFEGWSENTS
jgi:hypothetical protein